ncbi:hypothetical protein M501DRAFT_1004882 [Patellaria atrata CBS 101060]|uniref:DUF4211 domain-containing protein n=1 Tax=Patellaria atrata CBS 101060 TaxID=1346257 RepID=A0A9P4SA89_9PEZI|nr:hypothetical protein M501DRAFT_1004882 [Patellaria atrata CBS 101060]
MFQEDENDEDFIVSDEDDTLGAPVDMPLAFTNVATMKAKGLFKYAVQWFVQRKINPAFDHDAEIYDLAFKKLDDQVKGLVGSKFTSSVWRQDFTYALQARPEIIVNELSGGFKGLGCEACGRQSHPATFTIQFQGTPYHIETLDEVSEEDSDDEPARRGEQYDSKGRVIPSEDRIYNLGVFCKNNATTAHTLAHWRYHLNDWIVDYLENQGYCSAEKLVERERWSTKKRGKYANEVVEEMMKAGEIERLYRDFQAETDTAREAKQLWRGRK